MSITELNVRIRRVSARDTKSLALLALVQNALMDERDQLPDELQVYYQYRNKLHVKFHTSVYYASRLCVASEQLHRDVLAELTRRNQNKQFFNYVLASIFWPSLKEDLEKALRQRQECVRVLQPDADVTPAVVSTFQMPAYPFQCLYMHVMRTGNYRVLVIIDRFSKWLQLKVIGSAAEIGNHVRRLFISARVCDEVSTSDADEFDWRFCEFLHRWGVNYRQSEGDATAAAPSYPFAKFCVASVVQRTAALLRQSTDENGELTSRSNRLLLEYMNEAPAVATPGGQQPLSPAICLCGRSVASLGEEVHDMSERWLRKGKERSERILEKKVAHEDTDGRFEISDHVLIRRRRPGGTSNWFKSGCVVSVGSDDDEPDEKGESYVVRMDGSSLVNKIRKKDLVKYVPLVACHSRRDTCIQRQMIYDDEADYCRCPCSCWLS